MSRQLDSDGTTSPIATAARHWKTLAAGTVIGGLLGTGVGLAMPVTHTAEARLAVAAGSDSAFAIAGFPLAARDLAQNYARWVQNNTSDGNWAQPDTTSITATPIPESGVIRIEAESPDPQAAVAAADNVSTQLKAQVDGVTGAAQPEAALQDYRELAPQVAEAWAQVSVAETAFADSANAANAQALAQARAALAEAQLIQDAQGDRYRRLISDPVSVSQLTPIAPAAETGDNRSSNVMFGVTAGAGLGLLIAFLVAALRDWRNRPRRRAAAGAGERAPAGDGATEPARGAEGASSAAGPAGTH